MYYNEKGERIYSSKYYKSQLTKPYPIEKLVKVADGVYQRAYLLTPLDKRKNRQNSLIQELFPNKTTSQLTKAELRIFHKEWLKRNPKIAKNRTEKNNIYSNKRYHDRHPNAKYKKRKEQ